MVATGLGKRAAGNGNGNGISDGPPTLGFELHSPDIQIPSDVVQYTQDKLNVRLGKYGRWVMGAIVHIRDLNGPKGGVAVRCLIEVRLPRRPPLDVHHVAESPRLAFDGALERIDRKLGRDRARGRARSRRPKKYYAAKRALMGDGLRQTA